MHSLLPKSILSTICYSDIFDYPLTQDEIWKYLIAENIQYPISNAKCQIELNKIVKKHYISQVGKYYYLKGREKIVALRQKRKATSQTYFQSAQWIANILSKIPSILCIGVSGSLAMDNIDSNGDIDLFFITSPHTIWITRMIVLFILQTLGIRRKRSEKNVNSTICTNMFLDGSTLCLPKQNLYIAHEIGQLKIISNKNNIYQKFVRSNNWINKYLPNALSVILSDSEESHSIIKNSPFTWIVDYLLINVLKFFEPLAHFFQYQYMKNHVTSEIVTESLLAFHPIDYGRIILNEYKKRLIEYKVSSIKY